MVVPRISTLSLPPDVGGLVRGSLTLALGNFASERRGGPSDIIARVKWWGERGAGSTELHFSSSTADAVRFDVRCGPQNFARYLKDMERMVLELFDASSGARIGTLPIETNGLGAVAPLQGTFTAFTDQGRPAGTVEMTVVVAYDDAVVSSFELNEHLSQGDAALRQAVARASPRARVPPVIADVSTVSTTAAQASPTHASHRYSHLPDAHLRLSQDDAARLARLTQGMTEAARTVVAIHQAFAAEPEIVREMFMEVAADRSKARVAPQSIQARGAPRLFKRLLPEAPSKSAWDVAMLIVALPGASASAPGNPEQGLPMDFVRDECALASDACMWAASGKWGALAGRATPLLVEMGRRSLDLRNGFREMAWNRGGAVPLDAIAWLLASVAPTAAPHALRCLLAAIDARMGGATEAVTYEQLRETMTFLLSNAELPEGAESGEGGDKADAAGVRASLGDPGSAGTSPAPARKVSSATVRRMERMGRGGVLRASAEAMTQTADDVAGTAGAEEAIALPDRSPGGAADAWADGGGSPGSDAAVTSEATGEPLSRRVGLSPGGATAEAAGVTRGAGGAAPRRVRPSEEAGAGARTGGGERVPESVRVAANEPAPVPGPAQASPAPGRPGPVQEADTVQPVHSGGANPLQDIIARAEALRRAMDASLAPSTPYPDPAAQPSPFAGLRLATPVVPPHFPAAAAGLRAGAFDPSDFAPSPESTNPRDADAAPANRRPNGRVSDDGSLAVSSDRGGPDGDGAWDSEEGEDAEMVAEDAILREVFFQRPVRGPGDSSSDESSTGRGARQGARRGARGQRGAGGPGKKAARPGDRAGGDPKQAKREAGITTGADKPGALQGEAGAKSGPASPPRAREGAVPGAALPEVPGLSLRVCVARVSGHVLTEAARKLRGGTGPEERPGAAQTGRDARAPAGASGRPEAYVYGLLKGFRSPQPLAELPLFSGPLPGPGAVSESVGSDAEPVAESAGGVPAALLEAVGVSAQALGQASSLGLEIWVRELDARGEGRGGARLVGLARAPLLPGLSPPPGAATGDVPPADWLKGPATVCAGTFPVRDVLGRGDATGEVSLRVTVAPTAPAAAPASDGRGEDAGVAAEASLAPAAWEALPEEEPASDYQHVFDVVVAGASRLPAPQHFDARRRRHPTGRYVRYAFPGEAEALFTRTAPCADRMQIGAHARHAVVLPAVESLGAHLAELAGRDAEGGGALGFQVWSRWINGHDTMLGSAELPIEDLVELTRTAGSNTNDPSGPRRVSRSYHLPLSLNPKGPEAFVARTLGRSPVLRVDVSYEAVPVRGDAGGVDEGRGRAGAAVERELSLGGRGSEDSWGGSGVVDDWEESGGEGAGVGRGRRVSAVGVGEGGHGPGMAPRTVRAVLSVAVHRACGLQAAAKEAELWLGSKATQVMGRASQLGPHAYARVQLFPDRDDLDLRIPPLRTPFQAHAFCPEWDYARDVPLVLDEPLARALASSEARVELWHHCPRTPPLADRSNGDPPGPAPPREVFLGAATLPLAALLARPGGVDRAWVHLRSRRGEHAGAVQLSLSLDPVGLEGPDESIDLSDPDLDARERIAAGSVLPRAELHRRLVSALAPFLSKDPDLSGCLLMPPLDARTSLAVAPPEGAPPALPHPTPRARLHVFVEQLSLPLNEDLEVERPRAAAYWAQWEAPLSKVEERSAPRGPVAPVAAGAPWKVPIRHTGTVKLTLTPDLPDRLSSSPLVIRVKRQDPPRANHPGKVTDVGYAEVDLLPLVTQGAHETSLSTGRGRWLSGTFYLVQPDSRFLGAAKLRVKVLLEMPKEEDAGDDEVDEGVDEGAEGGRGNDEGYEDRHEERVRGGVSSDVPKSGGQDAVAAFMRDGAVSDERVAGEGAGVAGQRGVVDGRATSQGETGSPGRGRDAAHGTSRDRGPDTGSPAPIRESAGATTHRAESAPTAPDAAPGHSQLVARGAYPAGAIVPSTFPAPLSAAWVDDDAVMVGVTVEGARGLPLPRLARLARGALHTPSAFEIGQRGATLSAAEPAGEGFGSGTVRAYVTMEWGAGEEQTLTQAVRVAAEADAAGDGQGTARVEWHYTQHFPVRPAATPAERRALVADAALTTALLKVWIVSAHAQGAGASGPGFANTSPVLWGCAAIDLRSLYLGLARLSGWYQLLDFAQGRVGVVKVAVVPSRPLGLKPETDADVDAESAWAAASLAEAGLLAGPGATEGEAEDGGAGHRRPRMPSFRDGLGSDAHGWGGTGEWDAEGPGADHLLAGPGEGSGRGEDAAMGREEEASDAEGVGFGQLEAKLRELQEAVSSLERRGEVEGGGNRGARRRGEASVTLPPAALLDDVERGASGERASAAAEFEGREAVTAGMDAGPDFPGFQAQRSSADDEPRDGDGAMGHAADAMGELRPGLAGSELPRALAVGRAPRAPSLATSPVPAAPVAREGDVRGRPVSRGRSPAHLPPEALLEPDGDESREGARLWVPAAGSSLPQAPRQADTAPRKASLDVSQDSALSRGIPPLRTPVGPSPPVTPTGPPSALISPAPLTVENAPASRSYPLGLTPEMIASLRDLEVRARAARGGTEHVSPGGTPEGHSTSPGVDSSSVGSNPTPDAGTGAGAIGRSGPGAGRVQVEREAEDGMGVALEVSDSDGEPSSPSL